ncbi:hypothetical protein L6164_002621 [Bauhinia variegata]|uniref:Uncharacterized protein n=1 Tax=Bauhinia variegata TaxID=167791 RepID=A0ACB9Q492_BAUVA|nr:hypothetical protein L6164_002621 [Bauhinia variegata]
MNLSISFTEVPEDCVPKPSQWDIVEEFPIGWSVKVVGNERFVNSFKIKKYEKYGPLDYKLVYCPGAGNICGDLGIHNRSLVVSDGDPFIVNFRKAFTESSVN